MKAKHKLGSEGRHITRHEILVRYWRGEPVESIARASGKTEAMIDQLVNSRGERDGFFEASGEPTETP